MTNREFFNSIITNTITDETIETARTLLAKLDDRNAKRAAKPSKTALANEPIKASIVAYVRDNAKAVASVIATACGISTQKASSLCGQLVADKVLTVEPIKVKGKGSVNGYSVADPVDDEPTDEPTDGE